MKLKKIELFSYEIDEIHTFIVTINHKSKNYSFKVEFWNESNSELIQPNSFRDQKDWEKLSEVDQKEITDFLNSLTFEELDKDTSEIDLII